MAPLLRRRLECFYCGRRSAQKYSPGLQKWKCDACEATNHLDKNGDITDPPALDVAPKVRYAQAIERPVSPVFESPDETLFCSTCIKNQHLLTQALASYLPPASDSKYGEYEKAYPNHRKGLEERYPQVCERCEPRVRERIRATGYAAKTDNLRRMMDKTRGTRYLQYDWQWRHVLAYGGALAWWAGLLGQVLWNTVGALTRHGGDLKEEGEGHLLRDCLRRSALDGWENMACLDSLQPLATFALGLGFVSLWWNPCAAAKLHGRPGRIVGLNEYWKLQLILNVVRLLAWYALRYGRGSQFDTSTLNAIHATMLAFNIVVSLISYRKARLDTTIRITFQESPGPVRYGSATIAHPWTPASSQETSLGSPNQYVVTGFPVNNLSTSQKQAASMQHGPPTPPLDSDGDEMDWTPAKNEFRPTRSPQVYQPTPTRPAPSPFYGRLPPAPIAPAQRLRNPPNKPTFRKVSESQQRNFFDRLTGSTSSTGQETHNSIAQTSQEEDASSKISKALPSPRRIEMAPQRFLPPSEETGLESLFNGVFSLSEDPPEVRAMLHNEGKQTGSKGIRTYKDILTIKRARWDLIGCISILVCAPGAWWSAERVVSGSQALRYISLGLATVVLLRELAKTLQTGKAYWRLSDILLLVVEVGVAIFLGRAVSSFTVQPDGQPEGIQSDLGIWPLVFFGALLLQEGLTAKHEMSKAIWTESASQPEERKAAASDSMPVSVTLPRMGPSGMTLEEAVSSRQGLPFAAGKSNETLAPLKKRNIKYQATI